MANRFTNGRPKMSGERVVNLWNSLPENADFSAVSRFHGLILRVDFYRATQLC